jgi:hypothetical protein
VSHFPEQLPPDLEISEVDLDSEQARGREAV